MILTDKSMSNRSARTDKKKESLLDIYKNVVQIIRAHVNLNELELQENEDGFTPLTLAAAEGTVEMLI